MTRLSRILLHSAGVALVLVIALTAAAGIFLTSSTGRGLIMARAIPALSRILQQTVHIGEVSGAWPGEIIITQVVLADSTGPWLEIDRLALQWHPLDLLRNKIIINSFHADDAHLLRLPVNPDKPAGPSPFPDLRALQETLSRIRVDQLEIQNLRVNSAAFGSPATISVKSSLKADGVVPTLRLAVDRRDAAGTATLTLTLGDDKLALNARAAIAGVNLQAAVAMTGAQALSGTIHGNCGGDGFCVKWTSGSIEALTTDIILSGTRDAPAANVVLDIYGIKDDDRSLDTFTGALAVEPDGDTLRVTGGGFAAGLKQALPEIMDILASDGAWSLTATGKNESIDVEAFSLRAGDTQADLTGRFADAQFTNASLRLNVRGAARLLGFEDTISQTRAEFTTARLTFSPHLMGSGTLTLTMERPPASLVPAAAFNVPLKITTALTITEQRLTLGNLASIWGPAILKGESVFSRTRAGLDHGSSRLTLNIAPGTFAGQTQPLHIDAKISGGFAVLTGALTAKLDDYARGAAHLGGIVAAVDFKRVARDWQVSLRADAKLNDGPIILTASGQKTSSDIVISNLILNGSGADLKGDLRFNLDKKTVTGTLNGPIANIRDWAALAGVLATGSGKLKLALGGNDHQRLDVAFEASAFSSPVLGADSLTLTATIDELLNTPKMKIRLKAVDGDIANRHFDQLTASADGSLNKIDIALQAKGTRLPRFSVDLGGTVGIDDKTEVVLTRFTLEDGGLQAALQSDARLTITDDAAILAPFRFGVGSGTVTTRFNLARHTQQVDGHITLAALSLGDPKNPLSSGQGLIDGEVSLSGALTQADADVAVTARFIPRDAGAKPLTAKFSATARNGRAKLNATVVGLSEEDAKFNADIPVRIDLSAPRLAVDMQKEASGALTWHGEIKPLWQLLGADEHMFAGRAQIDVKAAGTIAKPVVTGGLQITKGLYENLTSGTALHNIDLNVTAASGTLVNVKLSATDTGTGTVALQGDFHGTDDPTGWTVDLAGDLKQFHILRRDDITAAASGHVTYKGPVLAGTLGGNLQIINSEYRLGASFEPEVPLLRGLAAKANPHKGASPIILDVTLSVPSVLRTEGKGLEAFWRGDLRVSGNINTPDLAGDLTLARGTFTFLGKTFDLDSGTISFTGGGSIDPDLSIVATRQAEDITAAVTITGRASQPLIALSSQPALPQDEVLARLLFRKGMTQLGPLESLQLAGAVTELSGLSRGGLNGMLRRASGLDIVGFGGRSGDAIVLGRQVSNALYVGIEQNVSDSARRIVIEWRLTRHFSLQSTTTGEAGADFGVLWRRNY